MFGWCRYLHAEHCPDTHQMIWRHRSRMRSAPEEFPANNTHNYEGAVRSQRSLPSSWVQRRRYVGTCTYVHTYVSYRYQFLHESYACTQIFIRTFRTMMIIFFLHQLPHLISLRKDTRKRPSTYTRTLASHREDLHWKSYTPNRWYK